MLVVGEEALTLSSELTENGPIAVLEYNQGNIKAHSGVITGSSTDMIEVNASFEKECSGSPLIDSTKAVRGMANHLVYFKDQDGRWAGTPRSFAYKLNGAAWYSANWKQNNKTYGKSLREVDEFRTIVYTIAARWAKTPKAEVEYKESAGLDFDRWVKAHNDFVSDLSKKKSKGASDASEKMQKRYQESCNSLIRICEAKAKNLEFLCEDKKITKYLRIQFKWRSLELKKFCRFVTATAKQHERDRWM